MPFKCLPESLKRELSYQYLCLEDVCVTLLSCVSAPEQRVCYSRGSELMVKWMTLPSLRGVRPHSIGGPTSGHTH
jgi:hypothetical protein